MTASRLLFRLLLIATLVLSLLLAGCQASKRDTGTAIGVLAGAVAGSLFGKGAGKVVAVGLGALVGGFIGNQIGGHLDEQDQQALERESAKALSQSEDGETITWKNPETQAQAEITVKKTEVVTRTVPIIRSKEVVSPENLILIGEPYETLTDSNVRFGPSMAFTVTTVLPKGTPVLAVGRVDGTNWILVNRDKQAIGYVHATLLAGEETLTRHSSPPPTVDQPVEEPLSEPQPKAELLATGNPDSLPDDIAAKTSTLRPAVDLDKMVADYPDDESTDDLVAENIDVEAPARTVTMTVQTPEGTEETTVVATKSIDGAWEIL